MDDDLFLDYKEIKVLISVLKGLKFENFEIHSHYFRGGDPRHGVSLDKAKEIYYQFDKIIAVFKRPGVNGFKYNIVYRISRKKSCILCFFFDEKPTKLFNAIFKGGNIERRLLRKYLGFS